MKTKMIRAAVAAALTIAASVLTANADGTKRPMALMVMFDGLRADGIESGSMPNVMALRNGTWQTGYRNSLALSDGYLGQCLSAIASRPTFADEDWLILVTSDHGGYLKTHGESGSGTHGCTVPIVIAGTSVTAGRIQGLSYNFDVCASALAHFGITVSGMEATARDGAAETARPISAGLAVYMAFNSGVKGGYFGKCLKVAAGKKGGGGVRLKGSEKLKFENGAGFAITLWVRMDVG